MTIVFQGHITKTEMGPQNSTRIYVQGESRICPEPFLLTIPNKHAPHYLAGASVKMTLYPLCPPATNEEALEKEGIE